MINIKSKTECCGCNACGDVCAKHAIAFKTDIEGFWYPEVNKELCTNCGLCEKVCPVINVDELKKNDLDESICYAAEHKNIEVVFDSTSGGLFSALADIIYKNSGYVGGAVFNDDFSVSHYISNYKADLPKIRSSKYLQSNLEGFYITVRNLVKSGELVLVCGTPCQMAALRAFLNYKDYDNLIIADFICRGINSPKVWGKYIRSFEERYGSKVVYCKAKSKEYGWRNLTQKVILEDGRHLYETKDQSNFTKGYLRTNAYCRPSCYECKFKGYPRMSDITLADFWGIEKISKAMEKDLGTSLVMINSAKGQAFFEKVKSKINFLPVELKDAEAGNGALNKPLSTPKVDRAEFFHDLDKMTFAEIADKYINSEPLSSREIIKNILRRCYSYKCLVHLTPRNIVRLFRYNRIKDIIKDRFFVFAGRTVAFIDKDANINLNGRFTIGNGRISGSKLESRLIIESAATLTTRGNVGIFYGSDVEIFKDAHLTLGKGFETNINFTLICADSIEIGEDVKVGRNVTIRDNNGGHFINTPGYKNSRPIKIGNKVWLCEGCTIMPGVKIGDGAIIGAHSLVTCNVPAHSLVIGNPAQVIEKNILWKY